MQCSPKGLAVILSILSALDLHGQAHAGTISGSVADEGQPVSGAMVTDFSPDPKRRETVYADGEGRFRLMVDFTGELSLALFTGKPDPNVRKPF